MPLSLAGKDLLLGTFRSTITHIGLANAQGTELGGGSPGYARKPVTWTAVSGTGVVTNTADIVFDIGGTPTTQVTVARILVRGASSAGVDYGWFPAGQLYPIEVIADAATDTFANKTHALTNGMFLFFDPMVGASFPTGITQGTLYSVQNASANAFQVTPAGSTSVVNIISDTECFATVCVPEVFNSQGQYTVFAGDMQPAGTLL